MRELIEDALKRLEEMGCKREDMDRDLIEVLIPQTKNQDALVALVYDTWQKGDEAEDERFV